RAHRLDRRAAGRRAVAALRRALGAAAHRGRRRRAALAGCTGVERVAADTPVVAERNAQVPRGELAMARDPAEIQADIALTRRVIEQQLDALSRKLPRRWWTPWALGARALVVR